MIWCLEGRTQGYCQTSAMHKMVPPSSLSKELLGPKRQQRWCWSTLELMFINPGGEDWRWGFTLSSVWLNLRFALVLIRSSWHDLMESSLKPLLVRHIRLQQETGARRRALTCPRPCSYLGSQQKPFIFTLPPGSGLRHPPIPAEYILMLSFYWSVIFFHLSSGGFTLF